MSLNNRMGSAHESFLVSLLGGRQTRGSGNQWQNQMDGRHNRLLQTFAFAWDGKSTLGKSVGVSRAMWAKAVEQAHGERPMLALRWYDNERLDVGLDLITMSAHDAAELIEKANRVVALEECLSGGCVPDAGSCGRCGRDCEVGA